MFFSSSSFFEFSFRNKEQFWPRPRWSLFKTSVLFFFIFLFFYCLSSTVAGCFSCYSHIPLTSLMQYFQKQIDFFFSTGFLVRDFLTKADTVESYATEVSSHKDGYNGFNLTLLELG